MGGTSAERAISLKTGRAILASLRRQGIRARALDPRRDLAAQLRARRITFVYIALHGPGGEDGVIQGLLEWLTIPYTGSGVLASALAMDKLACKAALQAAGLPVAPGMPVSQGASRPRSLGLPMVVKPVSQGSAVGVSIVGSPRQWPAALRKALRYGAPALAEACLRGPEITVGVLNERPLPVIEIIPQNRPFYDYKAKYAAGGSRHVLPARLSAAVTARVQRLAVAACAALGVRGAARVDLIVDRRRGPVILEVNTIPGMTETSLLPEAARAAGIDFDALVLQIGASAVRR